MKKRFFMFFTLMVLITPIAVFADEGVCPLGEDVTKDLYGLLMILKIVAPLLCIGLSVFDAIKAVAKGDPSTDLKAVAKKFLKRMMYALILFFIPVLVDLFFQMADVWGANGTCDLMNPENNGASNYKYEPLRVDHDNGYVSIEFNPESATKFCGSKSKTNCDGTRVDMGHVCYWNNNKCSYKTEVMAKPVE